MKRPATFQVTHKDGTIFRWSFQAESGLWSTLGRRMNGWTLRTHDSCERFHEGNWRDFVPFVHRIAANYGSTCHLS